MATNKSGQDNNDILALFAVFAIIGIMLSIMWFAASPLIGPIYRLFRTVESLGIWAVFPGGWGPYFWSVPHRGGFLFKSIFASSVPFNLFSAIVICIIGWFAYRRVSTNHIDAYIKNDTALGYKDLMRIQAPLFPANEFFLLFPLDEYPIDRGPARFPMTAIELLVSCNAIEGIYDDVAQTEQTSAKAQKGWKIDEDAVIRRLVSVFGPLNPFVTQDFSASRPESITAAVNKIPWHLVSIVYVCLLRIYAMDVYNDDDDAFADAYSTADDHLKNIWREINDLKKKAGDFITLGFIDADDETLKRAIAAEKDPNRTLLTLQEALDEQVETTENGVTITTSRGNSLRTTRIAREGLVALLTAHISASTTEKIYIPTPKGPIRFLTDLPASERKKKEGSAKSYSALSDTQKARVAIRRKAQIACASNTLRPLISQNGYVFGLIATLLIKTRRGGILPPAQFRWLRFYDYQMWNFLRIVGMDTPTPEASGMFNHYKNEEKAHVPFLRPYLTSCVEGIRREAGKYITDTVRSEYRKIATQRQARDRVQVAAKKIAETMRQKDQSSPKTLEQTLQAKTDELERSWDSYRWDGISGDYRPESDPRSAQQQEAYFKSQSAGS